MSRVGKKPITIPAKTTVTCADQVVTVKGELGTLTHTIHHAVGLKIEDAVITVTNRNQKLGYIIEDLEEPTNSPLAVGMRL